MLRNSKYVYGDSADVMIPMTINFGEFIIKRLLKHGDKIAIINAKTEEAKTFSQIAAESAIIAHSLYRMGVRKGQTIGICSENHQDFLPTLIGVACTGARITLINYIYDKGELLHAMNMSKPSIVICSRLAYKVQEGNFKTLDFIGKMYVFGTERVGEAMPWSDVSEGSSAHAEWLQAADVCGQTDPLLLLYTSGTTDLAKGVELTHWNVISAICAFYPEDPKALSKERISFITTPWFHVLGLMSLLIIPMIGRKLIFLPNFDPHLCLTSIQKYKVFLVTIAPSLLVLLSKTNSDHDLSSVYHIIVGAAPSSVEFIKAVKTKFPNVEVYQAYGMTESTISIIFNNPEDIGAPVKPGSVGTVFPGVIIKVVDINTREPLGPNEAGEICVKGPNVMKGYIGKDRREDFDEEGFFRTGDFGYYDSDKHFFIVDRIKDLIKYKGCQLVPAEIEEVLLQHEVVRDAAVVGIPDREAGEVPLAFVVLQPDGRVTEEELKQFVSKRVTMSKQLRGGVRFVDNIPRNISGKITRNQLRIGACGV